VVIEFPITQVGNDVSDMKWKSIHMPDQKGKTAIVTGSNSGIGYHMAHDLAAKGAKVTLACRNAERAEYARKKILASCPNAELKIHLLDLADLSSVRDFSDTFMNSNDRLDLLINNAGVMIPPYSKTKDGFELQFGTNFLGHFALTGHLLPLLEETTSSRIVSVSSIAHNMGVIDFDDIQSERKKYNKWATYSQSKLACLMFAIELDKRLKHSKSTTISLASHPGYSATKLQRHSLFWRTANIFFAMNSKKGAAPTLYAASMPDAREHIYWGPVGFMEMRGWTGKSKVNPKAMIEEDGNRLWALAERLTAIQYLS